MQPSNVSGFQVGIKCARELQGIPTLVLDKFLDKCFTIISLILANKWCQTPRKPIRLDYLFTEKR